MKRLCLLFSLLLVGQTYAATHVILYSDDSGFNGDVTVTVGDTITWTVNDSSTHTVTPDTDHSLPFWHTDALIAISDLSPGENFTAVAVIPGSFPYHCHYHTGTMTGTITVNPSNVTVPLKNIIAEVEPGHGNTFLQPGKNFELTYNMESLLHHGNFVEDLDLWVNTACRFHGNTTLDPPPSTGIPTATGWIPWDWDEYIKNAIGWSACGTYNNCDFPCYINSPLFNSSVDSNVREFYAFYIDEMLDDANTTDLTNLDATYTDHSKYMLEILETPDSQVWFNSTKVDIPAPNGTTAPKVDWRLTYCTTPGDSSTAVTSILFGQRNGPTLTYSKDNNNSEYEYPVNGLGTSSDPGVHIGAELVSTDEMTMECPGNEQYVVESDSCESCPATCGGEIGIEQSDVDEYFVDVQISTTYPALKPQSATGAFNATTNAYVVEIPIYVNCSSVGTTDIADLQQDVANLLSLEGTNIIGPYGRMYVHIDIPPSFCVTEDRRRRLLSGPDPGEGEVTMSITIQTQTLAYSSSVPIEIIWTSTDVNGGYYPNSTQWNQIIYVGDSITWTNSITTGGDHKVISTDGMFPSSGIIAKLQNFTVGFPDPGVFPYHCSLHPNNMTGTITVVWPPVEENLTYWIQPQEEMCTMPPNSSHVKAWCYPTAMANMIGSTRSYIPGWSDPHENIQYPNTFNAVPCDPYLQTYPWQTEVTWVHNDPWADMMYHSTNPTLNIGHYTQTDITGTTLENGRDGIIQMYAVYGDNSSEISVTIVLPENKTDEQILEEIEVLIDSGVGCLLHIKAECMQSAEQFEHPPYESNEAAMANIVPNEDENYQSIYGNQFGHTVAVYDTAGPKAFVASGVLSERGPYGTYSHKGTHYIFPNTSQCIEAYTSVNPHYTPPSPPPPPADPPTDPPTEPPEEEEEAESDTSSGLGTVAIAGISVGGCGCFRVDIFLLAFCWYCALC